MSDVLRVPAAAEVLGVSESTGDCQCGCGQKTALARTTRTALGIVKGQPNRFVNGHGPRHSPVAFILDPDTGCWVWQRTIGRNGYGMKRGALAHRYFYERLVGPIPDGLTLDHLCRNKACVNPSHLEPVTSRENTMRCETAPATINARKTHCKRGHPFDEENTIITWKGDRSCRICALAHARRYYRERKAANG